MDETDQRRIHQATQDAAHWKQVAENLQDIIDSTIEPDDIPKIRRLLMQRREIKAAWLSSAKFERYWRASQTDLNALAVVLASPPEGWFTFGSHIDQPDVDLEFWGAGSDGEPIWERPV